MKHLKWFLMALIVCGLALCGSAMADNQYYHVARPRRSAARRPCT